MKKLLLLLCAFVASIGVHASVFDTNVAEGATAKNLGTTEEDAANVLNATGVQFNNFDSDGNFIIVVDLGSSKAIDGFALKILDRDRYVTKFSLFYSTDNVSYTSIGTYETGMTARGTKDVLASFDSQINARYIKYVSEKQYRYSEGGDNNIVFYSEGVGNFQLLQYGDAVSTSGVDASQVLPIFSPTYNLTAMGDCNETYGGYKDKTGNDLFISITDKSIQGKTIKDVTGVGICGRTKESTALTGYAMAYIAIYPTTATKGYIFEDNGYDNKVSFDVISGQWNYITVPVNYSKNFASLYLEGETEFYLADFYFIKPAAGEIVIAKSGEKDVVMGDITLSNKSTIEASTASIIDISNANLAGVTEITLKTNQFLVVDCTSSTSENDEGNIVSPQGATLTGNTKNVIAKGEYYYSYQPIEIIDDNAHQPNTHISINTYKTGYSIQRTIGAGKYVTTYLPIAVAQANIPTGLTVYQFDASSTTDEVKFNKVTGDIAGATPYVLHNSTEGDLTLTATHAANTAGDFNLSVAITPVKNTNDDVSFIGNYAVINGDGSTMWGLQNSTGKEPEFNTIGTGAKIGAFRAYFTGLTPAGARAIFDDLGGTTSIRKIEDILNQNDVYYNLNGQRVLNPTKGIYILNGKKVIVK